MKRFNLQKFIKSSIVLITIYLSGNPLFHMIRYKESVMFMIFFVVLSYLLMKYVMNRLYLNVHSLFLSVIIGLSFFLTIMFNKDYSLQTYMGIYLQLIGAILITEIMTKNEYELYFIKIMNFLMIVSLAFYILGIMFPKIWMHFPQEDGKSLVYVNALYIYIYPLVKGTTDLFKRNMGVFWEPGCYQFFLNMSLFLILNNCEKAKTSNKTMILVLLYIVTMITTKSTTGLVIMIIILIMNRKKLVYIFTESNNSIKKVILICCLVCITLFVISGGFDIIINSLGKIVSKDYMGPNGLSERLSLNKMNYLFIDGRFHLFGIGYNRFYSYKEAYIWNSILEDTITLGLIFVFIILFGLIKYCFKFKKQWITVFSIFILTLFAESLFHTIVFFCFTFYGILEKNEYL